MTIKIGINGFGRIGRQVFKAIQDRYPSSLQVVAVNDLTNTNTNAHLLKYDTNYGRFPGTVEATEDGLVVNGNTIRVHSERDPGLIPWGESGVEIVVESTGVFTDASKARLHVHDTVKKVIISAPAKDPDATIVLGVIQQIYCPEDPNIISNASCTTNCLAPVAKVLQDNFIIKKGLMATPDAFKAAYLPIKLCAAYFLFSNRFSLSNL